MPVQQETYLEYRDVRGCLPSASLRNPNDPRRLGNDGEMRIRWGWPLEYGVSGRLGDRDAFEQGLYHNTLLSYKNKSTFCIQKPRPKAKPSQSQGEPWLTALAWPEVTVLESQSRLRPSRGTPL
jgi:hypothetical protein